MTRLPTPIRYLETITKHVQMHFGTNSFVLHENKSSPVHVDLHVVPPTNSRPYFTLLTSGMSGLDMHVPAGLEDLALAEVCMPDRRFALEPDRFWVAKAGVFLANRYLAANSEVRSSS